MMLNPRSYSGVKMLNILNILLKNAQHFEHFENNFTTNYFFLTKMPPSFTILASSLLPTMLITIKESCVVLGHLATGLVNSICTRQTHCT